MEFTADCRRQLRLRSIVASVAWAVAAQAAVAAGVAVDAVPTSLASTAERMISYRHQEHSWQTADGAFHALVNRGTQVPGPGLSLWSSYDGGVNWSLAASFANTDDQGTGDGELNGNALGLVYPTTAGTIVYARLAYDSVSRSWAVLRQDTIFASGTAGAYNPACGSDELGAVWCAFVATDSGRGGKTGIRMVRRAPDSDAWLDTGLVFGTVDSKSGQRSARPVRIPGGMGMVFSVRETTFWGQRSNGQADGAAWSNSAIYVSPSPTKPLFDPYSSHFSVIRDDAGLVHVLQSDDFYALYLRRGLDGTWTAPVSLEDGGKAQYCQIGIVDGKLTAAYSLRRGAGDFLQSTDGGQTWAASASLNVPRNTDTLKYGSPRVEMPTRSNGGTIVLQQFEDTGMQRLMVYRP